MADGTGGSVQWTQPGYAETDRRDTGNRTQTDYSQAVKQSRREAFLNGSNR